MLSGRAGAGRVSWLRAIVPAIFIALPLLTTPSSPSMAQQALRPGEAVVTRFSGTTSTTVPGGSLTVIDPEGTSASIIDLRSPGRPPQGDHWINEPQRNPVTAQPGRTGLRRSARQRAVRRTSTCRRPRRLACTARPTIRNGCRACGARAAAQARSTSSIRAPATRRGRSPTSPSTAGRTAALRLGNIAYDRWNQQLFVSDMETGMIHRIRSSDGADLGFYDHGVQGRSDFLDATSKQQASLPPIPFDSSSQARIANCPYGPVPAVA